MKKALIIFVTSFSFLNLNAQKENIDNQILRIPVTFRVVHKDKIEGDIKKEVFEEVIKKLNKAFNNVDASKIDYQYRKLIGKSNIIFELPSIDKKGNKIENITWHKTRYSSFSTSVFNTYKLKLFRVSPFKFKSNKFLNIFVCKMNDRWGYATKEFVDEWQDSVVIDIDYFLSENIYALTHEIGHYLGLEHIWGSKNQNNKSCQDSDFVSDTPNQTSASYDKNRDGFLSLKEIATVCGDPTRSANYQNFMDYSLEGGMFTKGQVVAMRNYIKTKRAGLLWKSNCNETSTHETGHFTDSRDNQKYPWVQIGKQKWMSKNLNYASTNSSVYDDKESNATVYGRLYTWEDAQNVCPLGWRIPSKKDWDELLTVIGDNQNQIRSEFGWHNDKNGTNTTGLNIYPGGVLTDAGFTAKYQGLGKRANFWLADKEVFGYSREIGGHSGFKIIANSGSNPVWDKLSCRCLEGNPILSDIIRPKEKKKKEKPKEGNTLKRLWKNNGMNDYYKAIERTSKEYKKSSRKWNIFGKQKKKN